MADTYAIRKGDTLSAIARDHGTTAAQLAEINAIADPDLIHPGDRLVVPTGAAPLSQAAEALKSQATGAIESAVSDRFARALSGTGGEAPMCLPPLAKPPVSADGANAGALSALNKSNDPPGDVVCPCSKGKGGKAKARLGGDENSDGVYAEAEGKTTRSGALGHAEGKVGAGLARVDLAGKAKNAPVGGALQVEAMTADAALEGGLAHGAGGRAKASARMVKQGGSVFAGNDMNNPLAELGGEYELLAAEAKVGGLLGSDGKRAGLAFEAGAEAAAAKGDIQGEVNIPIPFTDWTMSLRGKGGGKAGAVGAGARAHAYKNLESGRYHIGAGGDAAAIFGLGADVDLSVGPRYAGRDRPDGP